jgi:hypothetical protein
MCIFDNLEAEKENEAYFQQLKELILYFSNLKTFEERRIIIKIIKDGRKVEREIRN